MAYLDGLFYVLEIANSLYNENDFPDDFLLFLYSKGHRDICTDPLLTVCFAFSHRLDEGCGSYG